MKLRSYNRQLERCRQNKYARALRWWNAGLTSILRDYLK